MLLPHRFAEGCIDPDYRAWQESRIDLPAGPARQWVCRMDQVWDKPNGMPESVSDRVRASHEYWFHLTKEERYYSNLDMIREPHTGHDGVDRTTPNKSGNGLTHRSFGRNAELFNPLGKLPGSVWSIPSEPLTVPDWLGVDHYAAFPTEWPRRLILGWSPPGICTACGEGRRAETAVERTPRPTSGPLRGGRNRTERDGHPGVDENFMRSTTITGEQCACPTPDAPTRPAVVLDPFGGTGTVAMIARALGRYGISVDLSADYLRLAEWRIFRSGHWVKAAERSGVSAAGLMCDEDGDPIAELSLFG
jgi:hypothetical protein